MKKLPKRAVRDVLSVGVVSVILLVAFMANPGLFKAQNAKAGTTENTSGFAWSENIGWISFNNTSDGGAQSYGVSVDTTNRAAGGAGAISGNAWSEHIGWVSFNRADTGTPPAAPFNGSTGPIAQVDWSTGKVTGWARALSGKSDPQAGGWDGWIKLSDDAVGVWTGKGVQIAANKFAGYAWGSDVVGWIDFAPKVGGLDIGVQISAPPCTVATATTWGSCQALSQCTAPPATQSNVPGVRVGLCASGGTIVDSCTIPTQTCTTAPGAATTTRPTYQQF